MGRWCYFHTGAVVRGVAIRTCADRTAGTEQAQPFTFLSVAWVSHLRLFIAMVENYVSSVVNARRQVLCLTSAKLVNTEDQIIGVRDSINVILK